MDILQCINDSDLSEAHKEIARLRYVELKCYYSDVRDTIGMPQRTFYRKSREVERYVAKAWQLEQEKACL